LLHLALAAALLLPALDGESVTNGNNSLAVISIVSIVFGYLLLAGLWFFVFRAKARDKRKDGGEED
jgi:predicted permease